MTESYSVEEHLSKAREIGSVRDEGVITLNRVEAFRKLAAHSFDEPGLWVLKFVQAAVAANVNGPIDFKLFRKRTQITLQNAEEWSSEFILDLIQGKVSSFSRAAGHLKMGLLGALGDGNQRIAWTCQGTTCTFDRDGARFTQETAISPTLLVVQAHRGSRKYSITERMERPLRYVFAHALYEYTALTSRCKCSPVEVRVDGLSLVGEYAPSWRKLPLKRGLTRDDAVNFHVLLGEAGVAEDEAEKTLSWPLPTAVYRFFEEPRFTTDYLNFPSETNPCKAVLDLYYGVGRYSRISYVHDGVEIQSFPLGIEDVQEAKLLKGFTELCERNARFFSFNLTVEIEADRLDLGGFSVRPYCPEKLFRRIRPLVAELVEKVVERCHLPWSFIPPDQSKSRFRNISITGFGLGMAGGASLLIPGLNLIVVPAVAICTMLDRAGGKNAGNAKNQKMLRDHSEKLLDLLSKQ